MKYRLFSRTVSPSSAGSPAVMILKGSPPVWVSMVEILVQ